MTLASTPTLRAAAITSSGLGVAITMPIPRLNTRRSSSSDTAPRRAIYGPDGNELASAKLAFETLVSQRIPMGAFRARHRQPVVHTELFLPVFEQYRSQYGPNLFDAYQPTDPLDAGRYLQDKARWPRG